MPGPTHPILRYEVVRLARITPVSDRWVERNGFTVKRQPPESTTYRQHHFGSASAEAVMNSGLVRYRDVKNAITDMFGDVLYKFVS